MIIKKGKSNGFTVINNALLKDANLSLKAKGMLCLMFSLPENWNFSTKGLTMIVSDGEASVRSVLKELETNRYLIRKKVRDKGVIVDWEYQIFDEPYTPQDAETPDVENPHLVNRSQLNTNRLNTNIQNTNTSYIKYEGINELNNSIPKVNSITTVQNDFSNRSTLVVANLFLKEQFETYPVIQEAVDKYQEAYRNINVIDELKKMDAWLYANPTKRKTRRGMPRFINGWLAKANDNASARNQGKSNKEMYTLKNGVETSNPFLAMLDEDDFEEGSEF